MFTGIVTDLGTVTGIEDLPSGKRFSIASTYPAESIEIGASIACSGPCLTVVEIAASEDGSVFAVDVSTETLARTNLGSWTVGTNINLERSLRVGDELGGHIVTGHVDGLATIVSRAEDGGMARFDLSYPDGLDRYIAEKGSVSLDGVSLTVNSVAADYFSVLLIPHSLAVTSWGVRQIGDSVNLEVDLFARYLDRLRLVEPSAAERT